MSATYKLVFGIVIDAVQGIFIFFFDSLPSHVPFGSRAGQAALLDDDNQVSRHDPFVHVTTRVELSGLAKNDFLQLLNIQIALVRGFHKKGRGRTSSSNDDTFGDQISAHSSQVILDGPENSQSITPGPSQTKTHLVSHLRLFSLLIQSSTRPCEAYDPGSISRNRSPV